MKEDMTSNNIQKLTKTVRSIVSNCVLKWRNHFKLKDTGAATMDDITLFAINLNNRNAFITEDSERTD